MTQISPPPLEDRLAKAARDVDLDHLPAIAAPSGGVDHDRGVI